MFWFLPSLLTPTFFFLGLAAISLPILFHFFRRTPRGSVQFSTLMFLQPSPPRLTRRSRVDNWLLLLLRGFILLLIALAFGRVFFRQTDFLNISNLPSRRVAILIDTSASMKRGDLWEQAKSEVEELVNGLGPNDEAAIFTFDEDLTTLVGFSRDQTINLASRKDLILGSLKGITPKWRQTNLGSALINVSERLEQDLDRDSADQISESQIVLISDLQSGADTRALQSFEWPKKIPVELRKLNIESPNNATLSLMQNKERMSDEAKLRVKVSNVEKATSTQFDLKWISTEGSTSQLAATIVVPPGESRVLNMSPPDESFVGLQLEGDEFDFDNQYFIAYPKPIPERVLFLGENEDTRGQLLFYLKKACSSLIGRRFVFLDENTFSTDLDATIVFVVGPLAADQIQQLISFRESGGMVCFVVTAAEMKKTLTEFFKAEVSVSESNIEDFALLGEIDFENRMFARFADPKYSNFANVRFWKHRQVTVPGIESIARFDNGDLAIGWNDAAPGSVFLFASGWHPSDSQFALSTKFVGVMMSMMLKEITRENLNFELGQPVDVSRFLDNQNVVVTRPDGEKIQIAAQDKPSPIPEMDSPGIYQFSSSTQTKTLAFNLPPLESQTALLDKELLEQAGIALGTMDTAAEKVEIERQRRDKELENQQKLWRWMLILALFVLALETVLSGYFTQKQTQTDLAQQEN